MDTMEKDKSEHTETGDERNQEEDSDDTKKRKGSDKDDKTANENEKRQKQADGEKDEQAPQTNTTENASFLPGNTVETNTNAQTPAVSKRQLKRQQRHARWLEGKAERRRRQREKERAKRALGVVPSGPSRKALKRVRMADSGCQLRVALDLSLDALMDERRLGQCLRQTARCYSANRRAKQPLQLYVTSFQGRSKDRMSLQAGYANWDVHFRDKHFLDEFPKDDVVYLTSESATPLTTLDHTKVYIIGGLVDYNRLKGHCLQLAEGFGVATAHLPLARYLDMRSRKVLTIDQVFRVILGVAGGQGWREALLDALPARKGARGKEDEEDVDEEEEEEDDDEGKDEREDNKSDEYEEEKGDDDDDDAMRKNRKNGNKEEKEEEQEEGIGENADTKEKEDMQRER